MELLRTELLGSMEGKMVTVTKMIRQTQQEIILTQTADQERPNVIRVADEGMYHAVKLIIIYRFASPNMTWKRE